MNGDFGGAASVVGVFAFAWAGMQFIFQPVLGGLSDRFGRRPVIILSNLGLGLDYVMMALAPNLWFLFVGRLISGLTAASISTAGAYIADVTPREKRAAKFGLLGAAFGLGFVIGPAVGQGLGPIGQPFMVLSLEIGIRFVATPVTPWVLQEIEAWHVGDGYATGPARLWAEDGNLCAIATQTANLRLFPTQ